MNVLKHFITVNFEKSPNSFKILNIPTKAIEKLKCKLVSHNLIFFLMITLTTKYYIGANLRT